MSTRVKGIISSHNWRPDVLAPVLHSEGLIESLFDTKEGFDIFFSRVKELMKKLEEELFGTRLGLSLYYEFHLTLSKILAITQVASKSYQRDIDRYKAKVLLHHPFRKECVVKVPRLAPSRTHLEPIIRNIERNVGVQSDDEGRFAFKNLHQTVGEILSRDSGKLKMPPIGAFLDGKLELPLVISFDATGFGAHQLTTIVAQNPYGSRSAEAMHIFGLGRCPDSREGVAS